MVKPKHEPGKRWGLKFKDKRDWPKCNEELVVRGEFLLDLDWVRSWDKEVGFSVRKPGLKRLRTCA